MIANLKSKLKAMSSSSHLNKDNSPSSSNMAENTNQSLVKNLKKGSFEENVIRTAEGEYVRFRTVYGFEQNYGRVKLSDLLTSSFDDCQWWTRLEKRFRPKDIIFLDTETTGLSGGTGTVAFLIGLGYIEDDDLVIDQYFMRDFDEEYPMLQAVLEILNRYKVLVTFNGKSFDWPLLESRLISSRIRPKSWEDAHLDLLHIGRRLWGAKLENCSLISIEENILDQHRSDDIPSYLIPNIYLDYLQTRNPDKIQQVIRHNEWDIAALAALLTHTSWLYYDPKNRGDAYELFGIAKELERNHRIHEAALCYKACIDTAPNHPLMLNAKKQLAYLTKRYKGPQEAMNIWADLAGERGSLLVFPLVEMAKYLEHKEKDYQKALECTERAIALVNNTKSYSSQRLKGELSYRKQRLIRKIERSRKQWG